METMTNISRDQCAYMSDGQFAAMARMQDALGPVIIQTLAGMKPEEQLVIIDKFLCSEQNLRDKGFRDGVSSRPPIEVQAPAVTVNVPETNPTVAYNKFLKLDVAVYHGKEDENLNRWLTEVSVALDVQKIREQKQQVAYGMSKLRGRARDWAYACIMKDAACFPYFATFRQGLIDVFQPPKCEFRIRQQLLAVRQGNQSLHEYVSKVRSLSTNLTSAPMDEDTLVALFLHGLKDGPVRTQLFRMYPKTLEEAISTSIQEEFSRTQAQRSGGFSKGNVNPLKFPQKFGRDPMAMDVSTVTTGFQRKPMDQSKIQCFRCKKYGHMIKDCRVKLTHPNVPSQKKSWSQVMTSNGSKNARHQ
jgi:hypothetical protein